MGFGAPPRVVVVTRATDYEALVARHGTESQARFWLETHGQSIDDAVVRHARFEKVMGVVSRAIPTSWRRARIDRADLCRFVFEPDDLVVCVGQDGLVANAAKYLEGQRVIGVNADPERYDGILVPHRVGALEGLLARAAQKNGDLEVRTMVEARTDDGQRLVALNEIFIGHSTHQSARYRISSKGKDERQSSSGVVVSTGTGATGWARSISLQRRTEVSLPKPTDRSLVFFVREAFPSVATGTSVTDGALGERDALELTSEMNDGGTLFGDGIEQDSIAFRWGLRATVRVADRALHLVR